MSLLDVIGLITLGATVGTLLITAIAIFSFYRKALAGTLGVTLALTLALMTILNYAPLTSVIGSLPFGLPMLISGVASINIYAFWAFGQALFRDDFRLRAHHLIICAATILIFGLVPYSMESFPRVAGPVYYLMMVFYLGLALHVLFIAVRTSSQDLIKERREFRVLFIILAPVCSIVINLITVLQIQGFIDGLAAGVTRDITVFLTTAILCSRLILGKSSDQLFKQEKKVALSVATREPGISTVDQGRLERLRSLLHDEKIYREPGLQIRDLADAMAVPEHQLRQLINGRLGYRNFSSLVNEYRIEEVCQRLRDIESLPESILQLAFDVGYQSLAPFNRAFRDIMGMTPTEYRAATEDLSRVA